MSSTATNQFDRQIIRKIEPFFEQHGFSIQSPRLYQRRHEHEETESLQIVEFLLGRKSRFGLFNVNMAVYNSEFAAAAAMNDAKELRMHHCLNDLKKSLGQFHIPPIGWFQRRFGAKGVHGSAHWWLISALPEQMSRTLDDVGDLLKEKGLPWLDRFTCKDAFSWAKEQSQRRQKWLASGKSGSFLPSEFQPSANPSV